MTFGSAMFERDLVEKYDKPFGGRHHWPVARLQLTEGPSRLLAHRRDVIREPGRARDVGCSLLRHGRFRTSGSETVRPGWSTRRSTSHRACSADRPCPSAAPATSGAGQQPPFSAICRSSCSRWDSEKASSIDLPSCGRNASTNTARHADRRAVGDLACDDARVAVAYDDGFAQVAFL